MKAHPYIVCFGGEDYFLDKDLDAYRKWPGRAVTVLDGAEVPTTAIVDACQTLSFDMSPRAVIVDNAHKVKTNADLAKILEKPSDPDLTLVAICRSEKLPALWASASKSGVTHERAKLKTYSNNNEVVKWIASEAKSLKLRLSEKLPDALYLRVGGDLRRLSNELQKLRIYVGSGRDVTVEDIIKVCVPTPASDVRMVCDKTFRKEPLQAVSLLSILCANLGEATCLIPLVAMFQSQVEKLLLIRSLLDSGTAEKDIGSMIDMNQWLVNTTILPIVRGFKASALRQHANALCKLEKHVKGSSASKRTLVELFILDVAR